ncbi:MAG TPA: hypothetical protein VE758_01210 [Chthoniobacterales bacterium]|jgi:hypothetical protein|nr:hypothetical protein [Chthoniobacterales bacterium]
MKNYVSLILLLTASIGFAANPPTYTAPIRARAPRKPPAPPPIYRENVQGVVPRAVRGGNPLQMFNPNAPAKYGTSIESTSFDPDVPGKWKGIKLFEFLF